MGNPYDALAEELQPPTPAVTDNPYDAIVEDIHVKQQQRARTVYEKSLGVNPDQAAESVRLAKQTGLPPDAVERNLEEIRRKEQARLLDLQRMAMESPVLARQLSDPTFTKQAHDDVGALEKVERTFMGTVGDVGVTALKGAVGLPQAFVGLANLVTGGYAGKGVEATGVKFNETQKILDTLYSPAQQAAQKNVEEADGFYGTLEALVQNPSTIATMVGESLPQLIGGAGVARGVLGIGAKTVGAGMAGPNIPGALVRQFGDKWAPVIAAAFGEGTMAAGAAAEQFRAENNDGLIGAKETLGALGTGVGTAVFGLAGGALARRLGLDDIDTVLAAKGLDNQTAGQLKQGFIGAVTKAGIAEGVFEELPQSIQEQMWQNWVNDKPLGQGVGKAAAQGVVAGFAMGGGFQAIGRIGDHFGAANEAQMRAEQLQQQLQAATGALLRERNPEEFRGLMQQMAENTEGAPQEIYLDAEVLNQLPQAVLEQLPASVLEQLPEALAANDVVAIPVADVLTVAPGTPLEQALVENARIGDPMAMTQAEAKVAGEQAQQFLMQEAERVIQQATDQQAMQESSDRVKQSLITQLNTANRFRKDVNEAYATWTTAFYTTMAGRLGITPEEMAARYPLRIAAQGGQGAVLNAFTNYDRNRQLPVARLDATFEGDYSSQAMSFYKENIQGTTVENADIGPVQFSSEGGSKMLSTNRENALRASVVRVLPQLVQNAALTDAAGDRKGRSGVEGFSYLVAPMEYEGKMYAVRMAVKRSSDGSGNGKFYTLEGFKADAVSAVSGRTQPNPGSEQPSDLNTVTLGEIDQEVNELNRLFQPFTGPETATTPIGDATEIEVDGVLRSTTNSNGKPIAQTEEGLRNFWRWFGDSKVVDEITGRPLVLYHGTKSDFAEFAVADGSASGGFDRAGYHFTDNPDTASLFSTTPGEGNSNVMPVYLALQDPLFLYQRPAASDAEKAKSAGNDGLIGRASGGIEYVAFSPTQIKSATGNRGTFDPANPNILNQSANDGPGYIVNAVLQDSRGDVAKAMALLDQRQAELEGAKQFLVPGAYEIEARDIAEAKRRIESGEATLKTESAAKYTPDDWAPDTELIASAKKVFGVTSNPMEAGYVLPDGTMLDFSGRHYSSRDNWPYLRNQRSVDHRELQGENLAGKSLQGMLETSGSEGMYEFMARTGAMRIDAASGVASISRPPTPKQVAAIGNARKSDYLAMSFNRPDGEIVIDTEIEAASPAKVKKFFDDAMKEKGGTGVLAQGPRGTFNPQTLELVLNENADLSTFLHETGHFFLEVMADLASQPGAPADIQNDMAALLKWFGIKGDESLAPVAPLAVDPVPNRLQLHAKNLRDLAVGQPSGSESNSVLRFEPLVGMLGEVADAVSDPEVLRSVVAALPVDVVNVLAAQELPAEQALNNVAVLQNLFTVNSDQGVAVPVDRAGALASLLDVVAERTAERSGVANMRGAAGEGGAAVGTGEGYGHAGSKGLTQQQEYSAALAKWNSMTLDEKRKYHERFAESFEEYLLSGKAPSLELQPLFRKFRAWLTNVYRSLKAFIDNTPDSGIVLSPEIRQVFDRMLASEEQIAQAEEVAGLLPDENATAEAIEQLTARSLRDLKWTVNARAREIKKLQQQAAKLRKDVEAEVRAEVEAQPVYQAQDAIGRIKGQPTEAQMETIAEQFGYTSASEMVQAVQSAEGKAAAIEGMADQRMLERHGDLVDQRAIEQAANEAVHNEARARALATELKAQADMLGARQDTGRTNTAGRPITVNVIAEAAKQFAANVVGKTKIGGLKSRAWQHVAAERRAGKRWQEATAKGETEEAVKAKQDQVLNNAAAKASNEAVVEMEKGVEYLKKFDKESTRKKLPPEYLDQIDELLEKMDLRVSTSGREIERRASLRKWVESQRALGLDPIVPDEVMDAAQLTSYKEMTVDEMRAMLDVVKNIEHLGRLKGKLLAAKDKREFDAAAEAWAKEIRDNGGKAKEVKLEGDTRLVKFFKGAWADHRKVNSLVRQFAGGTDNGEGFKLLVRSMNERGTQEDVMIEKASIALAKIHAPIEKLPGGFSGAKLYIPEIRNSLTRAGRLAVALNWGNEQNRQRVRDGDAWTDEQVAAILKTLTSVELKFVNDVWEYLDSYWPEIKAKQERVSGVVEEKVAAEPFEVVAADGSTVQMRGGYYPIKYDGDRSLKSQKQEAEELAKDMLRGAILRPSTRRGHTKARADEVVGRPIKKDLSVITQHITQVVHDLAWHEWAIDANRLLNDPRIASAIRDHYGAETHRAMTDAVEAIVVGDVAKQTDIDRLLLMMRANVTRSIMGVSFTTAMLQPFGLTQSMARIGVVPVLKGAGRWAGEAVRMENSMKWISEKSDFMRLRNKTFNRDIREISQRVKGKSKVAQVVDASLFMLMQKMQMVADVPTWIGAYEKALNEGADQATAVQLADEAVLSSQGGGNTRDLAAVQRDMPFLTQFYSYFSTTLQLVAESTAKTDFKNPRAAAGWLGDMALLTVIPAILPALITYLLKGGGDDDEPEDWAKRLAEWQASYMLGMFVGLRELPALWSPFDYGGPPAAKLINDGRRLVQQANQGEIDDQAVLATIGFLGTALGLPTTQIIRSYKGWLAWDEGDAPVTSVLFGPPPKN
jgi:hypothetical protein